MNDGASLWQSLMCSLFTSIIGWFIFIKTITLESHFFRDLFLLLLNEGRSYLDWNFICSLRFGAGKELEICFKTKTKTKRCRCQFFLKMKCLKWGWPTPPRTDFLFCNLWNNLPFSQESLCRPQDQRHKCVSVIFLCLNRCFIRNQQFILLDFYKWH